MSGILKGDSIYNGGGGGGGGGGGWTELIKNIDIKWNYGGTIKYYSAYVNEAKDLIKVSLFCKDWYLDPPTPPCRFFQLLTYEIIDRFYSIVPLGTARTPPFPNGSPMVPNGLYAVISNTDAWGTLDKYNLYISSDLALASYETYIDVLVPVKPNE